MREKRRKRIKHYRNKERLAQQRARKRDKDTVNGIKMMFGCALCSEVHPAALHFHHKKGAKKNFGISRAINERRSFKLIIKEIQKCVVLCANCHAKEHYSNVECTE